MRLRPDILAVLLLLGSLWIGSVDPVGAQRGHPVLILVGVRLVAADIGLDKLRSAFGNQATDFNGVRLIPFNLPVGSSARQIVDRAVLGLSADRVGAFWVDQRIRFGTMPPRSIATPETLLRVVASMPGAIGYVQMNPTTVPAGVRVLAVEGKKPTDPGYLLQAR